MARISRQTKQKQIIQEIIEKQTSYFTASTLVQDIQKKNPDGMACAVEVWLVLALWELDESLIVVWLTGIL